MIEGKTAYPLCWPDGWRRMPARHRTAGKFRNGVGGWRGDEANRYYHSPARVTIAEGISRVLVELERMGIDRQDVLISTNVQTRLDGLPRSGQRAPEDPGAAVYWRDPDGRNARCMAVDRYDTVADNLAAIAATLEAMRAIERHGGAEILDRAFSGFIALPAPEQPWQVLGVPMQAARSDVDAAYRRLAMQHHPDRGGDQAEMSRINAARDAMLERCGA